MTNITLAKFATSFAFEECVKATEAVAKFPNKDNLEWVVEVEAMLIECILLEIEVMERIGEVKS